MSSPEISFDNKRSTDVADFNCKTIERKLSECQNTREQYVLIQHMIARHAAQIVELRQRQNFVDLAALQVGYLYLRYLLDKIVSQAKPEPDCSLQLGEKLTFPL
ncbi:MAG: hypothetical protein LBM73_02680 [Candidatus Nomurabacteria bacterium]|jgi:hypothetical protein|nr:hypothetical protein [Candidatus Nomurabacteria bacterium]